MECVNRCWISHADRSGDDPLYSEDAMGGQVDPLADDYNVYGGDPVVYGDPDVDEDL